MLLGLRAVLLANLDFARIASALVVVVGVTSHLGSGAALSPRRCRIASVGASNRTEMLRLRGVLLTILRLLGLRAWVLAILPVYKRILQQNSLAQHWARDWRALALTQVHHGSRLSDSCEDGEALSSVHSPAPATCKLIHNLLSVLSLLCDGPCEERPRYCFCSPSQFLVVQVTS